MRNASVFLDTNILFYAHDAAAGEKRESRKSGAKISTGLYFLRLQAGGEARVRRVVVER